MDSEPGAFADLRRMGDASAPFPTGGNRSGRSGDPSAHRVRPFGRRQPGCRPGRDAAGRPRARHRARRRDRDLGRRAQRRGRRLLPQPHRHRATRSGLDLTDRGRSLPGRQVEPGLERACAGKRTCSNPTASRHSSTGPRPPDPSPISQCRSGSSPPTSTAARKSCSCGVRSNPLCSRAPRCPAYFPIVEHDGRRLVDGGVVDIPCRSRTPSPDPSTGSSCSTSRRQRRPRRALAPRCGDDELHAFPAACGSSSSCAHVPPGVEVIVLPRPRDPRELFDFSGGQELIDEAYELAQVELDRALPVYERREEAPPPSPHQRLTRAEFGRPHSGLRSRMTERLALSRRGVGWRLARIRARSSGGCRGTGRRRRRSSTSRWCRRRGGRVRWHRIVASRQVRTS